MIENLPVFGAIVVVGTLLGTTGPYFSALCMIYLGARIGQSLAHLSSGLWFWFPADIQSFCYSSQYSFHILSCSNVLCHNDDTPCAVPNLQNSTRCVPLSIPIIPDLISAGSD